MQSLLTTQDLNLARKWRPQTFDAIVGQDVPIRMLKNSLFLKKFFPVYLFAGQRGCGKTTTARILASAVNCFNLESFQQSPTTNIIPCLTCQSCISMSKNNHPDFIEIDAASNTGVDNIRQLIEAASYVPLTGNKKIFLIDEAHMLSKAAFNAFLKILEEPPRSVIFILATTELHKIPQTVLSRCFQVIFSAINATPLHTHLNNICKAENITISDEALDLIIRETDGSARDAINLLEQIRFAHETITLDAIIQTLGKLSNETIVQILDFVINQKPKELLAFLITIPFERSNAESFWQTFSDLCKSLLWLKYESPRIPDYLEPLRNNLTILANKCTLHRLQTIMQVLWDQEYVFLRTSRKHAFLEYILIQIASLTKITDFNASVKELNNEPTVKKTTTHNNQATPSRPLIEKQTTQSLNESTPTIIKNTIEKKTLENTNTVNNTPINTPQEFFKTPNNTSGKTENSYLNEWSNFTNALLASGENPVLTSIFLQAQFIGLSDNKTAIILQLSNNSRFFKETIESGRSFWLPLLTTFLPTVNSLDFVATNETTISPSRGRLAPTSTQAISNDPLTKTKPVETTLSTFKNIADWPIASLIKKHIPGKIKKSHLLN